LKNLYETTILIKMFWILMTMNKGNSSFPLNPILVKLLKWGIRDEPSVPFKSDEP
jgi:hypothetical protein